MRVGEPPERERFAPGLHHTDLHDVMIGGALRLHAHLIAASAVVHADVHLADVHDETEAGEAAHVRGDGGVGGTAGRRNVHLKPDAVDRYALQQQVLQQHVDAIRFGRSALAAIAVSYTHLT